jgi:hypothetical protein
MATSKSSDLFYGDFDRAQLARIHNVAHELFGGGVRPTELFDLPVKLSLVRTVFRLAPLIWDDSTISHVILGGDKSNASAKFSRIKYGAARIDELAASMLAALINYIVTEEPQCDEEFTIAQRGEVLDWILALGAKPGPWLRASDVMGDTLKLASKLFDLADAHRYSLRGHQMRVDAQDCIVEYLLAPIDMAEREQRLIIQQPRARVAGRSRFGATQIPGAHPRHWKPLELTPGTVIEIGIPRRAPTPSTGWLVTLRNAVRANAGESGESPSAWVWNEGWENTMRWLPKFDLPADAVIAAPLGGGDTIMPLAGHYQVFLFVEPAESTVLTKCLLESGHSGTSQLPSDSGYMSLANALVSALQNNKPSPLAGSGIKVYTSSYTVTV